MKTTSEATLKTALTKARALIKKGWGRYSNHKTIGGRNHYCLRGAVYAVCGAFTEASVDVLTKIGNEVGTSVTQFNDKQRDKRQVIRVLDRIIARL